MNVDGGEDTRGELMGFQEATELEQGGGIRCAFPRQIDADETADGLTVVEGVFRGFIGKPEAVLRQVHAQHALKANRRSASTFATRVVGFNLGA